MNKEIIKFIIYLVLLSIIVSILKFINLKYNDNAQLIVAQIINTIYLFTPALAVLIVQKDIKKIMSYFKRINLKYFFYLIFSTLIILPLTLMLVIFIFGNIFDIGCFGKITSSMSESYLFSGVVLPGGVFVKLTILTIISMIITLFCGLLYGLILAIGSEIAWRGFLEANLKFGNFRKNLLVGTLWAIWSMPIILIRNTDFNINYFEVFNVFALCIVLSFYLGNIIKNGGTVLATGMVLGIINYSSITLMVNGGNFDLFGTNGLITVIPIIILYLLSKKFRKMQEN